MEESGEAESTKEADQGEESGKAQSFQEIEMKNYFRLGRFNLESHSKLTFTVE